MATRMPLMAMTAVQALCRIAKTIPDQLNNLSRERSESAESRGTSLGSRFCSLAIFSATEIQCSEVRNLRPICSGYLRLAIKFQTHGTRKSREGVNPLSGRQVAPSCIPVADDHRSKHSSMIRVTSSVTDCGFLR